MTDQRGMGGLPNDLTPEGAPGGPVHSGQYAYLAESGEWDFGPGDTVFGVPADKHFTVLTYGPYSSTALAEEALDRRIRSMVERGYVKVVGQMEPHARGMRGPHGGIVSWQRALRFPDPTKEQAFGEQEGWQQIRLVYVDEMP